MYYCIAVLLWFKTTGIESTVSKHYRWPSHGKGINVPVCLNIYNNGLIRTDSVIVKY